MNENMIETIFVPSKAEWIPIFSCQCRECPCLLKCEICEIVCEPCLQRNHQEEGTIGAKEFTKEVSRHLNETVTNF